MKDEFSFEQIHIEVARNATDDFNPFHDKNKWQRIERNPFGGPIVLAFQIEALIEQELAAFRQKNQEQQLLAEHQLNYSCYEFNFAAPIKPGAVNTVDISRSRLNNTALPSLSNRICVRTNGALAFIGNKRESHSPLYIDDSFAPNEQMVENTLDRHYLPNASYFLKRKYLNNSNAKNFLTGSLVEQSNYFDELEEKVDFPEMFPCSLISCALLERALHEGHNFERNPMVYGAHKICVDRRVNRTLCSNTAINILVSLQPAQNTAVQTYHCFGLLSDGQILFRAIISLIPLETILERG